MNRLARHLAACLVVFCGPWLVGCQSTSHADRGALLGGLGGAGVGALVGNAVGKTGAGAAIGAGVGALSGAALGNSLDQIEAQNRALIEQKLRRQVPPGAVTIDDVLAMHQAGVADELIVNHIRYHGMVRDLTAQDLIELQQRGLSPTVIKAMQEPPPSTRQTTVNPPSPPPVVVREHYYYDPWWGPYWHPWHAHYHFGAVGHRPRVGFGVTWHN